MADEYRGTYEELLKEIQAAERYTDKLEAYVAAEIEKDIFLDQTDVVEVSRTQVELARWFIHTLEQANCSTIEDESSQAAQSCLQNAWDTVGDHGVDYNSIVAQYIVASLYCQDAVADCEF